MLLASLTLLFAQMLEPVEAPAGSDALSRAEAAWLATKPRIDKTRDDIKKIAQETKPAEEPAQFAGRAVRRVLDELTSEKSKK